MRSYVKYVGNGRFQVQAKGKEFQRWLTERSEFNFESDKYYRFELAPFGVPMKDYLRTVFDLWVAIHNPKHRPTYYYTKD